MPRPCVAFTGIARTGQRGTIHDFQGAHLPNVYAPSQEGPPVLFEILPNLRRLTGLVLSLWFHGLDGTERTFLHAAATACPTLQYISFQFITDWRWSSKHRVWVSLNPGDNDRLLDALDGDNLVATWRSLNPRLGDPDREILQLRESRLCPPRYLSLTVVQSAYPEDSLD